MTAFLTGDVFPQYAPVYVPSLPLVNLTDDEKALVSRLSMKTWRQRQQMMTWDAYYRGDQIVTSLGIGLPPELEGLKVVLGWPRIAVDPYVERLQLDSFRLAGSTKADETLNDLWVLNNMDSECTVAYTEALIMGRAFFTVNTDEDADEGGLPEVCVESPLNMGVIWNSRTRLPDAVLQSYWVDNKRAAVLYKPEQTIYLAEDDNGAWELVNRDRHNFGRVPVIRMTNRPRANLRDGVSEISTALMSITDAASRTLLNLTAASEFYSVPQKLILGATEEDFIGSDGTKKSAWETYIGRILALQRDADGALPEIHQFDAYDPSVFTKVLDMYASQAAGILGAPPHDLGLYTQGNPVSAEAAQVAESRRDRRSKRMQGDFGRALVETAQMALRFMNGGELPKGYDRLAADWVDPRILNLAGTADGYTKLMTEGALPRASDVVMRHLGFSAIERRQMLQEIADDPGMELVNTIGSAVATRAIRATSVLSNAALIADPSRPIEAPNAAAPGA